METHSSILAGESRRQWSLLGEHARTDSARKSDYSQHGNLFHIFMNSYWVSQFSCSVVSDSATPWTAGHQASLSIISSWSLLKLMPIESVMPSNHLILCRPLHLLPSIFPSIKVFSNESVLCIRWPKYRSFSFSVSPSSKYSGLISFRI